MAEIRSSKRGLEYWILIDQDQFLPGILLTEDGRGICELWPYHDEPLVCQDIRILHRRYNDLLDQYVKGIP